MLERNLAMKLAGALAVSYPGRDVTERHANAWADVLQMIAPHEAERVVEMVRSRCVDPPSRAQLQQGVDEVRKRTMSPPFNPYDCVFIDGVVCRNCGETHGHLLSSEEITERMDDLRARGIVSSGLGEEESYGAVGQIEMAVIMGNTVDVAPRDPCDRCGHQSRRHAPSEEWSACRVQDCPCDGFVAVPLKAREVLAI